MMKQNRDVILLSVMIWTSMVFISNSSVIKSSTLCASAKNTLGQFWTDCSNLKFKYIPDNVPISTTHLVLSNNSITKLQSQYITNLRKLVYLDISNNLLQKLDLNSFKGLDKLKVLNISSNNLSSADTFPIGIFKPLSTSLLELDMRYNLMDLRLSHHKYPDEALSDLVSLTILKMNCIRGKMLEYPNLFGAHVAWFSYGFQEILYRCKSPTVSYRCSRKNVPPADGHNIPPVYFG